MKKSKILIIALSFAALCANVFGQNKSYPFEIKKTGQGKQAIIFIPGFASSGDVWNDTKSIYEKHFKCYVLTMAGFAGIAPQSNPSFENWEKAIADYIQQNKIEKPIIIGHSLGAGLAMALAADYPELISKIVVVDVMPYRTKLKSPKSNANNDSTKIDCADMIAQITAISPEQFYQMQKMSISHMVADTSKQEMVINWSIKSDRQTLAAMFCDFGNTDLRAKIANIKCPNLILMEAPFVNRKSEINEQFKNFPSANLKYASKGLHFIMYDDKEFYNEQLSNFIKP